jgi:hypothetical protein
MERMELLDLSRTMRPADLTGSKRQGGYGVVRAGHHVLRNSEAAGKSDTPEARLPELTPFPSSTLTRFAGRNQTNWSESLGG